MTQRYAVLLLPSANRVYRVAAQHIATTELAALSHAMPEAAISDVQSELIGSVPYMTFSANTLSTKSIALLSNLSSLYALFSVSNSPSNVQLTPITLERLDRYPSDLLSILKFAGKTNEQFTKLLINLTLLASNYLPEAYGDKDKTPNIRLLDPLCGRGTSLNQALMYGFDVAGVEIDRRDFDTYGLFINRWLKDNRLKHQSKTIELKRDNTTQSHRHQITLGENKEAFKAGAVQQIEFVLGDTLQSAEHFKKKSVELIVADLPYGIKHGNQSLKGLSKSPLSLLEQAIPVWATLLKPGGAMGLAWNTYLAKKSELILLLEDAGLKIYEPTLGNDFRHRVDQAIMRDLVIAVRV